MTLDDDLHSAGRREREAAVVGSTAADLRARRRRGKVLGSGAAAAAVALVAAVAMFGGGAPSVDRSIDVVGEPEVEEDQRLVRGTGQSVVVDAEGTVLAELEPPAPPLEYPEWEVRPPEWEDPVLEDPLLNRLWAELLDDPVVVRDLEAFGVTGDRHERAQLLATAGLRVTTSIDPALQASAEAATAVHADDDRRTANVVTVEHGTGRILALVGPDTSTTRMIRELVYPLDMVVARRAGVEADERIDAPATVAIEMPEGQAPWVTTNPGGDQGGLTLAEAVRERALTPWTALVRDGILEPEAVEEQASAMDLSTPADEPFPSLVLGTSGATPVDVGAAYGAIAAGGVQRDARLIEEIAIDSVVVHRSEAPSARQVIEPDLAEEVRVALRDVGCCGAGAKADLDGDTPQLGMAAESHFDVEAWFVGSTPRLTTVVLMGAPRLNASTGAPPGPTAPPDDAHVEIWREVMQPTVDGGGPADFPDPTG